MSKHEDSQAARARVPAPGTNRQPAGPASAASASGRASVGGTPAGRAAVGGAVARAVVRAVPPGSGAGEPDVAGGDGSSKEDRSVKKGRQRPRKSKAAKKRRRGNILAAVSAVLVILAGGGIVGGTFFFDGVTAPEPRAEDQMNIIYYDGGAKKVLAKRGEARINLPYQKINEVMAHAVVAIEDKSFYRHNGIDMKGIARAAWNNVTSEDKQGASTITQQYARHVAEMNEITYSRKLREAVIARKLESKFDKDQIMGFYLNFVDLGRGRYGVEAAAQGYFGKSVDKDADPKNRITVYEAAVLASIIKQPYPDAKTGHQGYDPDLNRTAAQGRWEETLKNMLDENWITQQEYDQRKYPTILKGKAAGKGSASAEEGPDGMIVRHVRHELREKGVTDEMWEKGGLRVTTTINEKVQKAAVAAGSRANPQSPMAKVSKDYQSAVIGIDPRNGRVLGYYGGDSPVGTDFGGYMDGDGNGVIDNGGQPAGSTFKIYTLAAGLRDGISFETRWNGELRRTDGKAISNAGQDPGGVCTSGGGIKNCDLQTATIKSYNFPFYWITEKLGVDKVIGAAKAAGVRYMWSNSGERIDLTTAPAASIKKNFSPEAGFGQFRIVPLEHAAAVATIVGVGTQYDAHFVKEVSWLDQQTGERKTLGDNLKGKQVFGKDQMSDLLGVMSEIPASTGNSLRNGRDSVAKSGTWELGQRESDKNGDCWFVGGIPQLAATVWVGEKADPVALKESNGDSMFGSKTPAKVWQQFLNEAAEAMKWEEAKFPERQRTGDAKHPAANGVEPPPEKPEQTQICQQFPGLCPNSPRN
ncbi:transglycosylase domain-containing protein [Actinoplanes sp. NEAU-A12]|uniref:Transglycosylase domain-containing protein n=1 Tax=Actinoplanes sandaracinus TaxID=3045177 RepID=A0ABT6WY92_9ACTN|nr:transglycosylase domain-containing protein [Actinoplanes sandaracinus]MDI6104723.1 transglycosylase domain-containing protein [Actinoplanes sandaracinus]